MNRRALIGLLVIIGLGIGGFFIFRQFSATSTSAATTSLQTATVERGTLVATVNAAGTIAAPHSATLTWETSGSVGAVPVKVGDVVDAGDVLMELDPNSLDSSLIQAQADLMNAQADLDTLLAGPTPQQLEQAKLTVIQAQQAITTAQRSLNSVLNPVSQALLDQVANAKIALDTATADQQLASVSSDVVALQNQIFVTTWYLNRLNQIKEESKGYEGNPDVQAKIQGAQLDYQNQYDKQMQLQLKVNTSQSTTANGLRNAQATYNTALANLQAAQRGPDAARVALYEAQLSVAKANLQQAETDLATLQAGPDPKDVAAAKAKVAAAQADVGRVRVTAPFRGTVVAIYTTKGDPVANGTNAVALADLSSFQTQVDVSEVDINRIAVGQDVNLTADAAPDKAFQGKVSQILILGKSQQGVVTFPVTVVIPDPDPELKPGMTAAVNIVTDQRQNVLLVPNRAVRVAGGQRTVVVLFEGQRITVPVTLGLAGETQSEVTGGQLKEGDTVVINASTTTTTQGGGGGFLGPFGGGGGFRGP